MFRYVLPGIVCFAVSCISAPKPTTRMPNDDADGGTSASAGYWTAEQQALEKLEKQIASKRGSMGVSRSSMVAACHPESTRAGIEILNQGGTAADAFIAATFVDYVVAPGTTSAAGPLGALVFNARSGRVENLHAGLKRPSAREARWTASDGNNGKAVLIPGAIAGLEALHKKYGRLPWKSLLKPAIRIARNGFPIPQLYANILASRVPLLQSSDYAKATFFHDGKPLQAGDILKQPVVAVTLERIAGSGAKFFYSGEYAALFVQTVNSLGGHITVDDLSSYQPKWLTPFSVAYRDNQVFLPGSHSFGGARLAVALKLLERAAIKEMGHWTQSPDSLALLARIYRIANDSDWVTDRQTLSEPSEVTKRLSPANVDVLWKAVNGTNVSPASAGPQGSHSYHLVVVDRAGNIVTGTNTIESMPWSDHPTFVGGIALNDTAKISIPSDPGSYILEPFSAQIVFKDHKPVVASGAFSASMFPADYQILSNILDFDMSAEDAVLSPRFGMYSLHLAASPISIDKTRNLLDKRFPPDLVKAATDRGVQFQQYGYIDTGMPVVVKFDGSNGSIQGMTPELLDGVAAGQ